MRRRIGFRLGGPIAVAPQPCAQAGARARPLRLGALVAEAVEQVARDGFERREVLRRERGAPLSRPRGRALRVEVALDARLDQRALEDRVVDRQPEPAVEPGDARRRLRLQVLVADLQVAIGVPRAGTGRLDRRPPLGRALGDVPRPPLLRQQRADDIAPVADDVDDPAVGIDVADQPGVQRVQRRALGQALLAGLEQWREDRVAELAQRVEQDVALDERRPDLRRAERGVMEALGQRRDAVREQVRLRADRADGRMRADDPLQPELRRDPTLKIIRPRNGDCARLMSTPTPCRGGH